MRTVFLALIFNAFNNCYFVKNLRLDQILGPGRLCQNSFFVAFYDVSIVNPNTEPYLWD